MTTKRVIRRKSYKHMSVHELVKAREDLTIQINEIDDILQLAVKAINVKVNHSLTSFKSNNFNDSAFSYQDKYIQTSVDSTPPQRPIDPTATNVMSDFSVFDADSWARQEAELSKSSQTDFDVDQMNDEISSLKQSVQLGIDKIISS